MFPIGPAKFTPRRPQKSTVARLLQYLGLLYGGAADSPAATLHFGCRGTAERRSVWTDLRANGVRFYTAKGWESGLRFGLGLALRPVRAFAKKREQPSIFGKELGHTRLIAPRV